MKNRTKLTSVLGYSAVLVTMLLLTQCRKEEITEIDCTGVTPTYTANIKSILDSKCSTSDCHSASSKKGGYDLSNYEGSRQAGGKTAFLGSIQHKSGYSRMPRGGNKLSDADVKSLTCWVQNGMPQ